MGPNHASRQKSKKKFVSGKKHILKSKEVRSVRHETELKESQDLMDISNLFQLGKEVQGIKKWSHYQGVSP